jgi:hypothetical protein
LEFTVILHLWRLCLVFYSFEETPVILILWWLSSTICFATIYVNVV